MNWFSLATLILEMSPHIVQSVEVLASHKAANGSPMTSQEKAAAGVQLGGLGLTIAGAATNQIPQTQVDALIQAMNDGTVAQLNAQGSAAPSPEAPAPIAPKGRRGTFACS